MTFMQFAEAAYSGVQKAFLGGRAIHPLSLNLILTYACNLQCHSCLYHSDDAHPAVMKLIARRNKQQLTWEEYERILIDAKKSGVKFVTLHGGEPTIHPLFDRLMDKITELGMKSSFVSNGYSTQSKAEVILRNNIRNINISIDGIEDLQDYIRGKEGLYNKQLALFEDFEKRGIKFSAGVYISGLNYKRLSEIVIRLIELKRFERIETGFITYLTEKDESSTKKIFDRAGCYDAEAACGSFQLRDELTKVDMNVLRGEYDKIRKYIGDNNIETPVILPKDKHFANHFSDDYTARAYSCNFYYSRMVVSPYGEVIVCPSLGMLGVSSGNIRNSTIMKEWNSEKFRTVRKMLNKSLVPGCNRCCAIVESEYI